MSILEQSRKIRKKFGIKKEINLLDKKAKRNFALHGAHSSSSEIIVKRKEGSLWALKRGLNTGHFLNAKEIGYLRLLFAELDNDGSGTITSKELAGPLLSAQVINNKDELEQVVSALDTDMSGQIDFHEFLSAFQKGSKGLTRLRSFIYSTQSLRTNLNIHRRRFILKHLMKDIPALARAQVYKNHCLDPKCNCCRLSRKDLERFTTIKNVVMK